MNTDLNLAGIIESARSVADKAALSAPDPNADLREAAEQFEAIFLNEFRVFSSFDICRTFEQKMFEEVCKSSSIWVFIFRANMIHYGNGNDRCCFFFVQNHVKPVVEIVFYELDFSLAKSCG